MSIIISFATSLFTHSEAISPLLHTEQRDEAERPSRTVERDTAPRDNNQFDAQSIGQPDKAFLMDLAYVRTTPNQQASRTQSALVAE